MVKPSSGCQNSSQHKQLCNGALSGTPDSYLLVLLSTDWEVNHRVLVKKFRVSAGITRVIYNEGDSQMERNGVSFNGPSRPGMFSFFHISWGSVMKHKYRK